MKKQKFVNRIFSFLLVAFLLFGSVPLEGFVGMELPEFPSVNLSEGWNKLKSAVSVVTDAFSTKASAAYLMDVRYENIRIRIGINLSGTKCELLISGTGDIPDFTSSISMPWYEYITDFNYLIIEEGITGIGNLSFWGMENLIGVELPHSLTRIGNNAFRNCKKLASITIPAGVTTIGAEAFYNCSSLTSINIPAGVKTIGEEAFYNCSSLTGINIPAGVTTIGADAFYNCSSLTAISVDPYNSSYFSDENGVLLNKNRTELIKYPVANTRTSYTIPLSVTKIGDRAFSGAKNLTSISILSDVTYIGDYAFVGLSLASIEIPDSVTHIGERAFSGISSVTVSRNNPLYSSDDRGVLFNKDKTKLIRYPSGNTSAEYTVPSSVTEICEYAFESCNNLENITISDGVTTIGDCAFQYSKNLISLTIPDSVTWIGRDIVYNSGIDVDENYVNGVLYIGNHLIQTYDTYEDSMPSSYSIKSGTLTIAANAFKQYFDYVTSLYIPNTVVSIGSGAFGSAALTNITIPKSVSQIGVNVFCEGLKSITWNAVDCEVIDDSPYYDTVFSYCYDTLSNVKIGTTVKKIPDFLFDGVTALQKISIPSNVTEIGEGAFCDCTSLASITISTGVKSIGSFAFASTAYVDNDANWSSGTAYDGDLYIGNYLIYALGEYNGPYTVKTGTRVIADYAFDAYGITSVSIPSSVVNIGEGNAYFFTGTQITVNASNNYYSSDSNGVLFDKNKTILYRYPTEGPAPSYTVPSSVTTIEDDAFSDSVNLTAVSLPQDLTKIGSYAFFSCSSLESIKLPDGITVIEKSTFECCSGLKSIELPYELINIGDSAFDSCSSLESIILPAKLEVIGNYAFTDCSKLKGVSIPDNVKTIGKAAFKNCSDLKQVYVGNNTTEIKENTFENCTSLESITIGKGVKNIVFSAIAGCNNLETIFVSSDNQYYSSDEAGILYDKYKTVLLKYPAANELLTYEMPDSVYTIASTAIDSNKYLEHLDIGSGLSSGAEHVWKFTNLSSIWVADNNDEYSCDYNYNILYNKNKTTLIRYPSANPNDSYNIYGSVVTIADHAFYECDNLVSVYIPDGVERIGNSAFENCDNLSSATIPASVTAIGNNAFLNCKKLSDVSLSEGLKSIGSSAFKNCVAMKEISMPDSVTYLGERAFDGCTLTKVRISNNVTTIYDYTFKGCEFLNVNIPEGVTSIGYGAFADCETLENIFIGKNIKSIDEKAFLNDRNISNIYYSGTETEWDSITIDTYNDYLYKAKKHFNCTRVTGFAIEPSLKSFNLFVADTKTVSYTTVPEDAMNREAYWVSSDPKIATVDKNGVVTGVSEGTVTITASPCFTDGTEISDSCTVTVTKKTRGVAKPAIESSTGVSCVLSVVSPTEGDGTVEYGWSLQNDVSTVTNWQTDVKFENLSTTSKYYFFCRVTGSSAYADAYSPATEIILACVPISGTVTLKRNGTVSERAAFGDTLTATFDMDGEYKVCWYRNSEKIEGVTGSTYILGAADIGCTITVAANGDEDKGYTGSETSNAVTVEKAAQPIPDAPKLYEATENSITIITENGKKYKRNDRYWITPDSETHSFTGLYPDTTYSICSIVTETGTHLESEVSGPLNIITALTYSIDSNCTDKQGVRYTTDDISKTACIVGVSNNVYEDIIIPDYVWCNGVQFKVASIAQEAFAACETIKTVTINDVVTSIGNKAFYRCKNLKEIYFDGAAPDSFGANVFDGTATNFAIYYYSQQPGWKESIVNGKYNGYFAVSRNGIEAIEISGNNTGYVLAVVDRSGNPLPATEVKFNGVSSVTDEEGYIFVKRPSTSTAKIYVYAKGFYPYSNENHIVNENLMIDFIVMNDDPTRIVPVSCNTRDIATGVAQINNKLDKNAQIVITGESEFEIEGYSIVQEDTVVATSKDGKFDIPNKNFQADKQVLAVLHTSYGVDIEQVLNIEIVSFKFLDSPISLGKSTSITFPKNIPLLGGCKMSLDFEDLLGNVVIDNDCLKIGYDMDVIDKDLVKLREDLWKIRKEKASKVSYGNFTTNVAGYYVAYFDSQGIYKEEGQLVLSMELSYNYAQEFVVVFVPIVVEIKITASGEFELNFKYDIDKAKWILPEINLGLAAGVTLYAGVGCRAVSAGVYGKGSITFDFALRPKAYTKEIYLDAALGLYAKGTIPWKWKFDKVIISADHANIYKHKDEGAFALNSDAYQTQTDISEIYDEENYKLLSRDYLATRSEWLYGVPDKSTGASTDNRLLQTSVFDNVEPKVVSCGNTTVMMYIDDNGAEDGYNSTDLVYSVYNASKNTWSKPQSVDGNSLVDGYVDVYSDGQNIYAAYVQANRAMTDKDKMADYSAAAEIAVAKFNFATGKFDTPTVITDNATIDMLPEIAVVDSVPTVVWVNNADNNMFGMTANNTLFISRYINGKWSTPVELVSESPCITSVAIGTLDSKGYVAYTKDIDCNLATEQDSVVCLADMKGNVSEVATETDDNFNVQFATDNGTDILIWYSGNNLEYITSANSPITELFDNPVSELTSKYQLVENNNGSFDVLFIGPFENGSDVYGIFFDEEWSYPVRVTKTDSERYVDAFSATYNADKLLIPYLNTGVTFAGDKYSTSSNLEFTTVDFGCDLCVEYANVDFDKLIDDKTGLLSLAVTNNGLSKIESVKTDIPAISYKQSESVVIMPGETVELLIDFNLPEDITADKLSVSVMPQGMSDINPSDNNASFKIGFTDFDVRAEQKIIGNINHVVASVTNNGNIIGSGMLQVINADKDGEVIYELPVENLAVGETRYYMVKTDSSFFAEGKSSGTVTVNVVIDEEEYFSFNNDCSVAIYCFEEENVEEDNLVPNSSIGSASAVFDKYVPRDIIIGINENGNVFEGISGLSKNNYIVGENVTISKSYLSGLEVGLYDFVFMFRVSETQVQERILSVTIVDSSPATPEISGEQIAACVYDSKPIEENTDFIVNTNSSGTKTFSYSSDNGTTWIKGLPVYPGDYLIKVDIAACEGYTSSSVKFSVTIAKAGRAVSAPNVLAVTNNSVSFSAVVPTVSEGEDIVYYGYSKSNDVKTVTEWSTQTVFENLDAYTNYYFFAKVTGGKNYADAISTSVLVATKKNTGNAPDAPQLESCTDTSVVLVPVSGNEYRCNDGKWQSSNVFNGLKPNQSYRFTQRKSETENTYASDSSVALIVTTDKSTVTAPAAPALDSKTDTTVTLTPVAGYEYRCNDGNWTSSNVFRNLCRNTQYSFYQRVAETDTSYASDSGEALLVTTDKTMLSGSVSIVGVPQMNQTLNADISTLIPSDAEVTYQWYLDSEKIESATKSTFVVDYKHVGHMLTVVVFGAGDYVGSVESAAVIPVETTATCTVVIEGNPVYGNKLMAVIKNIDPADAQYNVQWYRDDRGIKDATSTEYTVTKDDIGKTVKVKISGKNGYSISAASAEVIPVKQSVAAPVPPVVESVTVDSITLVKNDQYEYRIGDGKWQSSNVFTKDGNGETLKPYTEYTFAQRIKETETAFASAESEITLAKTLPIAVENISISQSKSEIIRTYSHQLTASVVPSNATFNNIIWTSSDESVATVTQNGFVTAHKVGTAIITASNGEFKANCVVTVISDAYTVKWHIGEKTITDTVKYKDTVKEPDIPEYEGYMFVGWSPSVPQTMPLKDLEFTAEFEPVVYYAVFVADEITVARVPYTVETESITAPGLPEKIGHTGKWNSYKLAIGGITVNAVYTPKTYTVTWVVDDKETIDTLKYGDRIVAPNDPSKVGYTFAGWTPSVPDTVPNEELTFYATWLVNMYDTVWNVDGKIITKTYKYGEKVIPPIASVKEGYTFAGWDADIPDTMPAKRLDFTAQWQINTYTVTWNADGKTTVDTLNYGAEIVKPSNPAKSGYEFIGWSPEVPKTVPANNLTFTAQYKLLAKQLKIKNPSVATINYGDTLILHADFGEVVLPEGYSIVWTVEGAGFNMTPAADGLTCKMTSVANGNATVKATLVDENGEVVKDANGNEMSDSKLLKSNANFWQKIVSFFKNLFRINRVIDQ